MTPMEAVINEYDYCVDKYGCNHILGTFLLGKANYGFSCAEDEYIIISVYLPCFEELCVSRPTDLKGNLGAVYDMRKFYAITMMQDIKALELLYTNYMNINPKYYPIFKEIFLDNREVIAHYCDKERLTKVNSQIDKALNNKDYFEAARLYNGAVLYSMEADVDSCFHLNNPLTVMLLDSLNKGKELSKIEVDTLKERMDEIVAAASDSKNPDAELLIRTGVVKLISSALTENISIDTFKSSLTQTEQKALDHIKNEIDGKSGTISISKMIEKTNISRPVWKNLLLKMEKSNFAEVINQGVKGTFIKFL